MLSTSETIANILATPSIAKHTKRLPIQFDTPFDTNYKIEFAPMPSQNGNGVELKRMYGLSEWKVKAHNKDIQLWRWMGLLDYYPTGNRIVILKKSDLKSFYRLLLKSDGQKNRTVSPPVLQKEVLDEIYANTIQFLERGKEKEGVYRKYNIPYKRGILLAGSPGTGKTSCCKWLRYLCRKHNLETRIITPEEYRMATSQGKASSLFRLRGNQRGILFFDDMDVMVKDRKTGESSGTLHTFLTNMDGLDATEGVVFIFTTNIIADLDEAFVRPGRIDLFITFKSPNAKLRHEFISSRFGKELLALVDVAEIVNKTDEYTYAEMEEIRKLLLLDFIDGKQVSIERTFKLFEMHRKEFKDRGQFGFGKMEPDDDYDDFPFAPATAYDY